MYAVILTGGKQYKVSEGDVVFIEKLEANEGDTVKFDKVLCISGDNTVIGTPVVEGASVDATVVKNGKAKKIIVFKYKPKKVLKPNRVTDSLIQRLKLKKSMRNDEY